MNNVTEIEQQNINITEPKSQQITNDPNLWYPPEENPDLIEKLPTHKDA